MRRRSLCLEALEIYVQRGETVIDVGCGSGILALAAAKLGAGRVIACEIQEEAVRSARTNFGGLIFRGSADAISGKCGDIVLANISARILKRIRGDLRRILKPDGVLIISGFMGERVPVGFRPRKEWRNGDWLCWVCGLEDVEEADGEGDVNLHPADWWM